jgi:hypothetical protein
MVNGVAEAAGGGVRVGNGESTGAGTVGDSGSPPQASATPSRSASGVNPLQGNLRSIAAPLS